MWVRDALLLRDRRLALDGRLLGRLELCVARDGDEREGATLRRVDDREPLGGALCVAPRLFDRTRVDGRADERLDVDGRLAAVEPCDARAGGAAARLLDGALRAALLDGRGEVRLGVADR